MKKTVLLFNFLCVSLFFCYSQTWEHYYANTEKVPGRLIVDDSTIYVSASSGINIYDITGKHKDFFYTGSETRDFAIDSENNKWFAVYDKGVFLLDKLDVQKTKCEKEAHLKSQIKTEGSFTDSRDGKKYKTVRIGNQTWMAENLNYSTGNSWCYDNISSNCNKYGRLYDWNTALKACPPGWRLPSCSDFGTLVINVGVGDSRSNAYHALKDGGSSGFSALFGGWRTYDGTFNYLGSLGYWWSSSASESETYMAWYLCMNSSIQNVRKSGNDTEWGFSVRCLQD